MSTFTFIAFSKNTSINTSAPSTSSYYLHGFSSLLCRWYPSLPICLSTDFIWYEYESSQPTKVTRGLGVMFMANYPPLTILCCPPSFWWAFLHQQWNLETWSRVWQLIRSVISPKGHMSLHYSSTYIAAHARLNQIQVTDALWVASGSTPIHFKSIMQPYALFQPLCVHLRNVIRHCHPPHCSHLWFPGGGISYRVLSEQELPSLSSGNSSLERAPSFLIHMPDEHLFCTLTAILCTGSIDVALSSYIRSPTVLNIK